MSDDWVDRLWNNIVNKEVIEPMKYKCPDCEEISNSEDWVKTEIGCEDCGTHSAIECPLCGWIVDLIFKNEEDLEVKNPWIT